MEENIFQPKALADAVISASDLLTSLHRNHPICPPARYRLYRDEIIVFLPVADHFLTERLAP